MARLLFILMALLANPALAESPLSASKFEALVKGRTLTYSADGIAYGAEQYLDNRRVRWSFLDGECTEGEWYAAGDQICFVYDDIPNAQCWQFFSSGRGLLARFENDPTQTELYETANSDEPLLCLGPKVGV